MFPWPYTNLHELNLDWILDVVKTFQSQYTTIDEKITAGKEEIESAGEATLEQVTAAIQQMGTEEQAAVLAAINARYAEVMRQIPEDYTAINSALDNISDIVNSVNHSEYSDIYNEQTDHTSPSANTWNVPNTVFNAGYVDSVSVYITDSTEDYNVSAVIIDADTKKVLYVGSAITAGHGLVTADIKREIPVPFLLGIKANQQGYIANAGICAVFPGATTFTVGETVTLDFNYTYAYSYKVNYSSESFLKLMPTNSLPSHDFNDTSLAKNTDIFFGRTEEQSDILNSPNGDVYGYWYLSCRVMKNEETEVYLCQTAYSAFNSPNTNGRPVLYRRYLIYNKTTDLYTNLSTDSATWRMINPMTDKSELSTEYAYDGAMPFSSYGDVNKANTVIYVNNHVYPVGYVKSLKSKINGEESSTVKFYIINAANGNIMRVYSTTGTGVLEVDVNEYIGIPFFLGVGGRNTSYASGRYSVLNMNFITFAGTKTVGDTIDMTFPERASTDTIFSTAHEVKYDSLRSTVYEERHTKSHNRLFAAGDSITAGYPHCNAGEHWWETIARTYGYTVETGAESGSGMAYWQGGKNACYVAHETDFSKYDVVIFAYGTNDYGNNIPIGQITDSYNYDPSVTPSFYGALNYVVSTVLTSNPKANLIFALPINRKDKGTLATNWGFGTANTVGSTLSDYCDAIIAVCNKCGINYIDRRNSVFNAYSLGTLLADNLHPTPEGYRILGMEMAARVGALIVPFNEYNGVGGIPYPNT